MDSIPEDAECSFYAYYYLGQKDKAIEVLNTALDKDKKGNCYDAACLYSVMGEKEKALSYLRQSLEDGYRRFAHIKRDRDLNNIRNTEEFKVLMKEYEEKHLQEIAADADGDDSAYELKVEEIPYIISRIIPALKPLITLSSLPAPLFCAIIAVIPCAIFCSGVYA